MSIKRQKMTTGQLAVLWGISPNKIHRWILNGELPAINAATRRDGRPRYLIDRVDIEAFEAKRAVVPKAPVVRQRRASGPAKDFF